MEVKLKKESISYYAKNLSIEFSQEETTEAIVPDALPDVAAVLDSDASAILRGKEMNDGRLTVSGLVFGYILYRSEDGNGLRRIPVQIPFTAHRESGAITQQSKCVVRLSLSSFEGRIINSRKLLLRAEVVVSADIFNEEICPVTVDADSKELELLKEETEFCHVCAVGEKTFSITEDMPLAASKPHVGTILKYRVRLFCDETKAVGSRIVVKGRAGVYVLYAAAGSGELCSADFSLPFSQIYDTDITSGISGAETTLMITGVYLEAADSGEGSAGFQGEIGVVAQFSALACSKVAYLSDAYSLSHEIEMTADELQLNGLRFRPVQDELVSQMISTAAPVRNIIDVYTQIGRQRRDGDGYVWTVSAKILYENESGTLSSAVGSFELRRSAADLPDGVDIQPQLGDVTAKAVSGGAELRLPVSYTVCAQQLIHVVTPTSIEIRENEVRDNHTQPSITVLRADGLTSLWSLAKQYNTTVSAITEANPAASSPLPAADELLLIVKKR